MHIINAKEFDHYWKSQAELSDSKGEDGETVEARVREIIQAVKDEGDAAVRRYARRFDKSSPETLEVPVDLAKAAWEELQQTDKELSGALELAAAHIRDFADLQLKQLSEFEVELDSGLFAGQRVLPVERAAVYVPGGRFPLFSSVLMGMIPAFVSGVEELVLASPPALDSLPDKQILASAALALNICNKTNLKIFAMGGAQAIAALALGTESVPKVSVIVGPGNKYVAAAKRMLFGQVGIDFVAGPTDVLVIMGTRDWGMGTGEKDADLIAADMLAQAEHDPDARARALVPDNESAQRIKGAIEKRLASLPTKETARASLDNGGLIIVYPCKEEAIRIANIIAPEHLELHVDKPKDWLNDDKQNSGLFLKNYGSLFIGNLAAEVLGDYSAGINHTLPTSGSARFTAGLSVRHFLRTPTSLRCVPGKGLQAALKAAQIIGKAEGLIAHSQAASARMDHST